MAVWPPTVPNWRRTPRQPGRLPLQPLIQAPQKPRVLATNQGTHEVVKGVKAPSSDLASRQNVFRNNSCLREVSGLDCGGHFERLVSRRRLSLRYKAELGGFLGHHRREGALRSRRSLGLSVAGGARPRGDRTRCARQPLVAEGTHEACPQAYRQPNDAAPTSGRTVFLGILMAHVPSRRPNGLVMVRRLAHQVERRATQICFQRNIFCRHLGVTEATRGRSASGQRSIRSPRRDVHACVEVSPLRRISRLTKPVRRPE